MMYGEGLDANAVLVLRMGVAFPFYVVSALMMRRSLTGISFKDWIAILILGLIGSAIVQKRIPSRVLIGATALSWIGLCLVVWDEVQIGDDISEVLLGGGLVLLSAIIYACYILIAKPVIVRVGAQRYTSIVMCISSVFVIAYFTVTTEQIAEVNFSNKAILYGVIIGVFCTVLPTYILSYGLSKTTASSYAVLSSTGPVATIVLSLIITGSAASWMVCIGVCCSIAGSLLASRKD